MIKKTIHNELDKIVGPKSSFFTGVEDEVNLFMDPYVTGYAFIYWLDLPSWFEKDEDLKYFKQLTQKTFRSFSGISPLDLNTAQHQSGFAGNEISVVTNLTRGNTEFSIDFKEYSGTPIRKMFQKWIGLIRDPRTGIALYPKLYNVDYGARNHSGSLMYINTRPDVTNTQKNIVEFAIMYQNVIPTNVPLDTLFNFEIGSQDSPTISITFKASGVEIGPDVEVYAKKILETKILSVSGDSYIPFVDFMNTNEEASNSVTWGEGEGSLSNIFGKEEKK
jgi:hypothetical protein